MYVSASRLLLYRRGVEQGPGWQVRVRHARAHGRLVGARAAAAHATAVELAALLIPTLHQLCSLK